jgi:hypothetical protein
MLPKLYGYGSTGQKAEATPLIVAAGAGVAGAAPFQSSSGGEVDAASAGRGGGETGTSASHDGQALHSVARDKLLAVLAKRRDRAVHCRSLPASVLLYAIFTAAVLIHVQVGPSFDVETGYVQCCLLCIALVSPLLIGRLR